MATDCHCCVDEDGNEEEEDLSRSITACQLPIVCIVLMAIAGVSQLATCMRATHLTSSHNIQHAMAPFSVSIQLHPRSSTVPNSPSRPLWSTRNSTVALVHYPTTVNRLMMTSTALQEVFDAPELADLVS